MQARTRLQALPWLLALPATGAAQIATQVPPEVRQGMMSTSPVGLLLASSDPGALLIADPGQTAVPPTEWSQARFGPPDTSYPDYSFATIFGSDAPDVVLSAVSTGNDWMPPILEEGSLDMTGPIWFGLTISVTNASAGEAGSHVARITAGGDSPGAELITYYAEGSVGLDASLPHTTVSERSRESLGLATTPPPPPADRADVAGIDYGLGVIPFDPENRAGPMFGIRDVLYFALAPECLDDLDAGFAEDALGMQVTPDAATIYVTSWRPAPSRGFEWSTPVVYCSAADLGLDPDPVLGDRIDAIAVSHVENRVIFSTQPHPQRSQLLVYEVNKPGQPMTLRTPSGVPLVDQFSLTEGSDVDGTAGIDPEHGFHVGGFLGVPESSWPLPGAEPLGVSLVCARPGVDGSSTLHVHVTGAGDAADPGLLALYAAEESVAMQGVPSQPGGPWALVGALSMAPGQAEASWTFPTPAVTLDLVVTAVLWDGSGSGAVQRASWVSMLTLTQ